jgi:hypothetical protein
VHSMPGHQAFAAEMDTALMNLLPGAREG